MILQTGDGFCTEIDFYYFLVLKKHNFDLKKILAVRCGTFLFSF